MATALLTLDRDSAYLLAGGIEGAEIGRNPWAEELVESRPFSGLWGYAALHRMVCSQLSDDAEVACDLDAIASRSERSGDAVVRIVALVFGSMRETRARARGSGHRSPPSSPCVSGRPICTESPILLGRS